ncbi:hypothetical protein DL93DRAFT_118688 [Clavulina sp. PMI_390]|nr:hypothetical protein DL93DRAFT_118688 [Clavulina sp. PMI_390]
MFKEVDELLDGTPAMCFEEEDGETSALLPQYGKGLNNGGDEEGGGFSADEKLARYARWVVNFNLIINIILLAMKVLVAFVSNSISLWASVLDSGMDLLSTIILYGASRIIENRSWKQRYTYPVGLRRAEPMGVVVFSVFMIASFVQVFIESCERLFAIAAEGGKGEIVEIGLSGIIVMLVTIVVKAGVWITTRGSKSSTVQALAQDAENDVVFNIMSLIFPFVGQKIGAAWLDPFGGLVLSLYIIVEWVKTLTQNIRQLMGMRRGPEEHQVCSHHPVHSYAPLIRGITFSPAATSM